MYIKSLKSLCLFIFIFTCFFAFIVSFKVSGIENAYKFPQNESIEVNKRRSGNSNIKVFNRFYSDKNKINNSKIYINNVLKSKKYNVNNNLSNTNKKYNNVYKVIVHIGNQTVNIYNNNELIKTMVCSTGKDISPTPKGVFVTGNKGTSFFSDKYGEGAYYWTSFYGNYLFHSVPFDKNKNIIQAEVSKLGEKASHGCVRLSLENAKWIYNNIPRNSKVYIET